MTRRAIKAMVGSVALAILSGACVQKGDGGGDGNSHKEIDLVVTDMRSWDACEVLDDLQPFADFLGVEEFTATVSGGNRPDSTAWGKSSRDPDGVVCGAGIDLGSIGGMPAVGGLLVSIVPAESEQQAQDFYDERASWIDGNGVLELARKDIGDPWELGILLAKSAESGATEYVSVVAREEQWAIYISLSFTGDYSAQNGGEPDYQFTNEELHGWLIDTYLPGMHQAINDRIEKGPGFE